MKQLSTSRAPFVRIGGEWQIEMAETLISIMGLLMLAGGGTAAPEDAQP